MTGEPLSTAINFTAGVTSEGYDFYNTSTTLTPISFNLDVDGNGRVTALGDGLIIIRKLFGAAFIGEKLTANAITSTATRTTDEIHEYIEAMSEVGSST